MFYNSCVLVCHFVVLFLDALKHFVYIKNVPMFCMNLNLKHNIFVYIYIYCEKLFNWLLKMRNLPKTTAVWLLNGFICLDASRMNS